MPAPARNQSGFSLVEAILTIVIITIAFLALIYSWSFTASRSADPFWQAKVAQLGQAYLNEILSKPYDELNIAAAGLCEQGSCSSTLGPEGESRSQFDDVDDYNGLNETATNNALGQVRPSYAGYQVAVNVSYAGGDFSRASQLVKKVEVFVTAPGETPIRFMAYRGNY